MDIYNNDDCEINVTGIFDLALELTKVWGRTQKVSATWYDVYNTYEKIKNELLKENKNEEDHETEY